MKENLLYYNYKYNYKIKEKKIPYIIEVYNRLYITHISDIYCNYKKSKVNLLDDEYYYLELSQN